MLLPAAEAGDFQLFLAEVGGDAPLQTQGAEMREAPTDVELVVVEKGREYEQDAIGDDEAVQRGFVDPNSRSRYPFENVAYETSGMVTIPQRRSDAQP